VAPPSNNGFATRFAALSAGDAAVATTVGHSSLAIPCGAPVQADWYKPSGTPTGLVWVQHGFVSSKTDVAGFAQDLATHTGALVVAPTITSTSTDPCWMGGTAVEAAAASLFAGDRAALMASARAAGWTGPIPQRFVLMGHSLGGNFAATVASRLTTQADLRAVVMLDGGSLDNGAQTSAALAALSGKTVLDVASPPGSTCKLGDLAPILVAARPGQFVGVQLVNGLHLDAIGYSNLLGNIVCGWPRSENIAAVQTIASQWTTNALTGATGGIIAGTPGQRISVGGATAVVLG
jgi:pimeloyl-ACP methyl ester carboxylesterase